MPSTSEKLSPSRVKLTVTITAAELKPYLDAAYKEIAKQVNIPGFRKGKVPAAIIDQRFGKGVVLQEAINEALPQAYNAAITESGELPLGDPEINIDELNESGDVVFTAEVDVRPDFDLPELGNLEVSVPVLSIPEGEVDERISVMRQRFATTKDVERAAASGDVLVIDLEGTKDGEALEDASAAGITYRVGDEGMLDGLEAAVTGLAAGETATFVSTLVGGAHEGEDAEITVTVVKVSEETLPEVDDEFAQLVSEFDTVDEMRADLAVRIEEMAKMDQIRSARDKALDALVGAVDIEAPEKLVASEVAARRADIEKQLGQMGMTIDSYLASASDEDKQTADEFWAEMEASVTKGIKAQIILDKLADDQDIDVTQEDLMEMIYHRSMQNRTSPQEEMQHMMEHGHAQVWAQEIRRNKALEAALQAMKIVDEAGNVVDVAPAAVVADDAEGDDQDDDANADA